MYLDDQARGAIKKYLVERSDDHPAVFATFWNPASRWTRSDAQEEFAKYAKKAAIQKRITAHTFRRTFCTTLYRNGADILTVKELAGHADIKTTERYYIARDQGHLKGQHEKFLRFE